MSKRTDGILLSQKGRLRLKSLLDENDMERINIAEKVGISYSQLSLYTSDKKSQRKIFPDALKSLAAFFGVSEEYILGESDYRNEVEARAAELHKRDDIGFITQSPIYNLLLHLGYELIEDQCFWEPHSRYTLKELGGEYRDADHTDEILEALNELSRGNAAPDRGPIYTFKTPGDYYVYIPADNFAAAEELIIGLARTTLKSIFTEWIGREMVYDRPPDSWLFPYPKKA